MGGGVIGVHRIRGPDFLFRGLCWLLHPSTTRTCGSLPLTASDPFSLPLLIATIRSPAGRSSFTTDLSRDLKVIAHINVQIAAFRQFFLP